MGYGEQLAQQVPPQSEQQKKAAAICTQSQKIKALIEDLNLTFKLQYNAQPLRRTAVSMGSVRAWRISAILWEKTTASGCRFGNRRDRRCWKRTGSC